MKLIFQLVKVGRKYGVSGLATKAELALIKRILEDILPSQKSPEDILKAMSREIQNTKKRKPKA